MPEMIVTESLQTEDDSIVLANGYDLFIEELAWRISTARRGVTAGEGDHTITVQGHVYGASAGIHVREVHLNNRTEVNVAAGASVKSRHFAIDAETDILEVTNNGTIEAREAVYHYCTTGVESAFRLTNTGVISGDVYTFSSTAALLNSGTIIGNIVLQYYFQSTVPISEIVNTGMLSGSLGGYNDGNDAVTNSGLIHGSIGLKRGDDMLVNTGYVGGDIDMGPGDDILDIRGGHVGGIATGNAGSDVYIVDRADVRLHEDADPWGYVDEVRAETSYQLRANFENLTLLEGAAWSGTGNSLDNLIKGNSRGNTLSGRDGDDLIFGRGGADDISGGDGRDDLRGGLGNDRIDGGISDDTIYGNAGDDVLLGGRGRDLLVGGSGDDILAGNRGDDTLGGGTGADTFRFNLRAGDDTVRKFTPGEDQIDLTSLNLQSFAADVRPALQVDGDDVLIDLRDLDGRGSIRLEDVTLADLYPADFIL